MFSRISTPASSHVASKRLHEPWQSMLAALDRALDQDTELHCMGGFVLAEHYGLVRPSADVDIIESLGTDRASIAQLAGRGSALHKRHRVHIDVVTVADVPDDYDARLIPMNVDGLTRLRLRAFERHDLVLAKLCRNIDRDREALPVGAAGRCVTTSLVPQSIPARVNRWGTCC